MRLLIISLTFKNHHAIRFKSVVILCTGGAVIRLNPQTHHNALELFFIYAGIVDFTYALPMGIAMMVGAFCGARMAIAKGATYVKTLFIIMSVVLIGKQVIDLFK